MTFFLFRSKANAYFTQSRQFTNPTQNDHRVGRIKLILKAILKIISITLYTLGCLCIFGGLCMLPINFPNPGSINPNAILQIKLTYAMAFGGVGLVFIFLGSAANKFQRWRLHIGAALMSIVYMFASSIVTYLCTLSNPDVPNLTQASPALSLGSFDDSLVSIIITVIILSIGLLLVRSHEKRESSHCERA